MTILFKVRMQVFPVKVCGTADPSASLGMTKERATFAEKAVAAHQT
jgi:hypothetical protein